MSASVNIWKQWRRWRRKKNKTSLASQKSEISSNPHFDCGVLNRYLSTEHGSSYTNLLALRPSACRTSALPQCIPDKSLSHSLRRAIALNCSVYLRFIKTADTSLGLYFGAIWTTPLMTCQNWALPVLFFFFFPFLSVFSRINSGIYILTLRT